MASNVANSDLGCVLNSPDSLFAGPASQEKIRQAEQDLGVTFPPGYRDFLRDCGAVVAPGLELYGITAPTSEPPLFQDVVTVNRALRRQEQMGADRPLHFAIADDGEGAYYFMVGAGDKDPSVYMIGPDCDRRAATNLADFLQTKFDRLE